MNTESFVRQLVGSPCCLPAMELTQLYPAYRQLGFTKYEAFCTWTACRHHWQGDADADRQTAARHGLQITSYHLPPIGADVEASFADALVAARYAARLGAKVVLFKAAKKELFSLTVSRLLDAIEREQLGLTVAVQNHAGSAISTVRDFHDVFAFADGDPRLKAVLEVGHFQRVGIGWREGWNALGERIALIHVNDIRDGKSVPYGTGSVDFAGLVAHIKKNGYAGDIVVELELENHRPQETLDGLQQALSLLTRLHAAA